MFMEAICHIFLKILEFRLTNLVLRSNNLASIAICKPNTSAEIPSFSFSKLSFQSKNKAFHIEKSSCSNRKTYFLDRHTELQRKTF